MPYDQANDTSYQDISVAREDSLIRPGKTAKKRNLVTLNTPLIIKKTIEEDDEENQIIKINKSYKQILDACLMDRTIKLYSEEYGEPTETGESVFIIITNLLNTTITFSKFYHLETEQTLYILELQEKLSSIEFYALDPNVPMTTINPFAVPIDDGTAPLQPRPGPGDAVSV